MAAFPAWLRARQAVRPHAVRNSIPASRTIAGPDAASTYEQATRPASTLAADGLQLANSLAIVAEMLDLL